MRHVGLVVALALTCLGGYLLGRRRHGLSRQGPVCIILDEENPVLASNAGDFLTPSERQRCCGRIIDRRHAIKSAGLVPLANLLERGWQETVTVESHRCKP